MFGIAKKIRVFYSKYGFWGSFNKTMEVVRGEGLSGLRYRFKSSNISFVNQYDELNENKISLSGYNSNKHHVNNILQASYQARDKNIEYVPLAKNNFNVENVDLRLVAFYLTQYHTIPENDKWWGKGFTEWTNVTRATPLYVGHYQPHLPDELGFYDLRLVDVMRRQVELAKQYGLSGFCFHYYWFSGKRLLELPLNNFIKENIDFPFCLCWANENWTRRWDGAEQDILLEQKYGIEDDLKFIQDIAETLKDKRYIRVNGKPVLIVYRVSLLPEPKRTAAVWRTYCKENGIGDICLVAVQSFGIKDPNEFGFDAALEFPPHGFNSSTIEVDSMEPMHGNVYSYDDMILDNLCRKKTDYKLFKTVAPGWDNTARKSLSANMYHGANPLKYARWLSESIKQTLEHNDGDERLMFVNAWNEWAEGAHLEPDRRFGYGYLHATANVLSSYALVNESVNNLVNDLQKEFVKKNDTVIILHLYYEDLLSEISEYINNCGKEVDVFISVTKQVSKKTILQIKELIKNPYVLIVENRGRDILPFLDSYYLITQFGYDYACKVHTKKSPHRDDGEEWRQNLIGCLLSANSVKQVHNMFEQSEKIGIVAAPKGLYDLSSDSDLYILNTKWLDYLLPSIDADHLVGNYKTLFPAGSMFWFRVESLKILYAMQWLKDGFELEVGQKDGTLAHAMERMMCVIAARFDYRSVELAS